MVAAAGGWGQILYFNIGVRAGRFFGQILPGQVLAAPGRPRGQILYFNISGHVEIQDLTPSVAGLCGIDEPRQVSAG
jgi:hypothetical protein